MSNEKSLDSAIMNQILKNTDFPADENALFLDYNIGDFFDNLVAQNQLKKSDVIRDANIARTYGYQILNGSRIAKRDYYLRIAIAMQLDLRTTQRLLAITQTGGLHPLIRRDAAVIFSINNCYNNIQTHNLMVELAMLPLEKDE